MTGAAILANLDPCERVEVCAARRAMRGAALSALVRAEASHLTLVRAAVQRRAARLA